MRRWLIAGGIVIVILAIVVGARGRFRWGAVHSGRATDFADPSSALNVDELMEHVDQYRGTIRVGGVVSSVAAGEKALSLIDSREFKKCGVTTCARLQLPVVGCFLVGCCGSPMLIVYINLFGAAFLPFAKPLIALLTVASISLGWWWMSRRSACSPKWERRASHVPARSASECS